MINLTYESYLEYMKHIKWKGSGYRVMTEDEFECFKDWIRFTELGVKPAQPVKQELF